MSPGILARSIVIVLAACGAFAAYATLQDALAVAAAMRSNANAVRAGWNTQRIRCGARRRSSTQRSRGRSRSRFSESQRQKKS